jgi:hypothetical protein
MSGIHKAIAPPKKLSKNHFHEDTVHLNPAGRVAHPSLIFPLDGALLLDGTTPVC